MATPVYATVIDQINTYIIANGNNEITANVLNPILTILADFTNNNIGDLDDLTTSENSNVVASINSLKEDFDNLVNNGVQLHVGYDDPNDTPPPSYNYADFYMQLDSWDETPIYLWQWNGIEWTNTNYIPDPFPDQDNIHRLFEFTLAYIGATDWNDDVQDKLAQTLSDIDVIVGATEIYRFKITNTDDTYQIWEQLDRGKGLILNDPSQLFLLVDKSVSGGSSQDLQSVLNEGNVVSNATNTLTIDVDRVLLEYTSGDINKSATITDNIIGSDYSDYSTTEQTEFNADTFSKEVRIIEYLSSIITGFAKLISKFSTFGGALQIGRGADYTATIITDTLTQDNLHTLPNKNGTIAHLPEISDDFINDAAAASGGIAIGGLYHTAGVVKIRLT